MMRNKKVLVCIVIAAVLVLVTTFACKDLSKRLFLFGDRVLWRSSEQVDLRDMDLTLEQYERLKEELPGCNIRWMIPIGEKVYDSAAKEITVSTLDSENIPMYMLFDDLQRIYAEQSEDYDALQELRLALPDCSISWFVHMGNDAFAPDAKELILNGTGVTARELMEKLCVFADLDRVEITDVAFSAEDQLALMGMYPDISFVWYVEASGKIWLSTETDLSYAGMSVDVDALAAAATRLPNVTTINLNGCCCTTAELLRLHEAYGAEILSELELYGVAFDTKATELDFSNIPIKDVSEVEKILPLLPHLQKIVMCNCGIPSEEMDALWKRNPQVRFVWSIRVGRAVLRTDCTRFTPPEYGYMANGDILDHFQDANNRLFDRDFKELKYCVDMVCLDVGHMGVSDYSFLQYMPKLKYLILADTIGTDFTPLKDLKELVYLELFSTDFADTELLRNLTKLEDLNISSTHVSDIEFLKQMPSLQRLWAIFTRLTDDQLLELKQHLPNTQIECYGGHPTANDWRKGKNYYDMRDFLGMDYLD